jgi:hypothetical protein
LEKKFLEQGMHAIQRRTGGLDSIPDEFVITSLDVIIHHDKKLGQGGSGQVFQADWQGTTVAIKIFGKGVPSSVSYMSTPKIFFDRAVYTCSRSFRRK